MDDRRLILHIEDDAEMVELVAIILQHPQLATISAPDGPTGLALAARHRPDLILLDIMLPEMDGHEVFDRLRASSETADIPVVMLTTLDQAENAMSGLDAGAIDYIPKDAFAETVLLETIKQMS